jgi:hypothetical protein
VNLSEVVAGQKVGVTQIGERVWLVTSMRCDVGSFDDETFRLERIDNTSRNSARSAGVSSVSSPHPSY